MITNTWEKFRFPLFLFIFLIQFLTFTQVFAQQFYPVQVRSYVQSPSVYLEDYYNPDNFRVQVTLTDRFVTNLDVVLNLTVKGPDNGVLFTTKTGIDIELNGGFTYTLSRSELGKLLAASNLSQVPTSIPEDTYTFSFSVTDRLSGATVSNSLTDFTTVLVSLFDPPMLTSPANGQLLDFGISGQNFMLSWIPRSFSLNPQEQVKYQLIMVQVPENRNAYDAIRMAEFQTNNTIDNILFNSFTYDQSLLALVPGYTYAWRIQAYEEKNGVKVYSRFRNEGKSDVFTFKVKEQCPPIFLQQSNLVLNPLSNKQEVLLSWNKEPKHELYEIKYRPLGSSQWTVVQQSEKSLSLGDQVLIKNKDYEYSVSAKCIGWQNAVYGGLFKLPGGDCEAPTPILVESNTDQGIILKWNAVPAANTYNLYYTDANGDKNELKDLNNPTAQLPAITAGAYTIRVDAVCSNTTATGSEMELAYNEQSLAGNCPIPTPFNFLAQRNLASTDPLEAKLSWPKLPIHEAYKITWYRNGSTDLPSSETVNTPEALVKPINSNEFYQYTIEYTCKGGKKSTTPVGGFRIEKAGNALTLSPTTADCFPPAVMNAEARSSTSARIDWAKVSGAQEYLVVYYPKGSPDQEQLFTTSAANARLTNLVEDATYTYKIRCRCSGNYSIDSEPGEFDLTQFYTNNQCDSVANLTINQIAETEIQLSWPYPQEVKNKMDEHSAYTIRYKENGQVWADAYTIDFQLTTDLKALFDDTKIVKKTIDKLSSGTKYDIEVKARCGTQIAQANESISATTKEEEAADCSSGGVCDRSSTKPISTIAIGDTIGMADCNIVVKTIEADSKGTNLWKGTGTTQIPLLGQSELIRANVYFDSLLVNETACVLDGNVDLNLENTLLSDEQKETIKGIVNKAKELTKDAKNISDQVADGAKIGSEYGNQGLDYFQGGGNVGSPKTGGLAEEAATAVGLNTIQVNGDQVTIDGKDYPVADFPKLFKDENGNVYSVAANGTKTEVGKYDTSLAGYQDSIPATSPVLTFSANSSARYAFDAWQTEYGRSVVMQPHYLSLSDKFYSAKAIIPATTDKVDFSLSDGKEKNLTFVNRDGFVFKTLDKNTLQVVGGPAGDAQEIFALYDDNGTKKLIGALLLASYTPKQKTVYIVPVKMGNSFDLNLSQMQEQLNKAYGSIAINYTVEFDKTFDTNSDWCEGSNCDFSTGGSGLLNNDYTGVEARVRDAYIDFKGEDNLDPDAAYLFAIGVTKADKGDEALEGKMNFGKQFGFLYAAGSQNSKTLGRTLAHELGHGNYKLHHIFADMYLGKDVTYTSNNLMSYKNDADALALNKLQWDVVHDPGVTWGVFKRDRDQGVAVQQEGYNKFVILFLEQMRTIFSESSYNNKRLSIDVEKLALECGVTAKRNDNDSRYVGDNYLNVEAKNISILGETLSSVIIQIKNEPFNGKLVPNSVEEIELSNYLSNPQVVVIDEKSIPTPPFVIIKAIKKSDSNKNTNYDQTLNGQGLIYAYLMGSSIKSNFNNTNDYFLSKMSDFSLSLSLEIPANFDIVTSSLVDLGTNKHATTFTLICTQNKIKFQFSPYLKIDIFGTTNQLLKSFEWDFVSKRAVNFEYDDENFSGIGVYPSKNIFENQIYDYMIGALKNTVLIQSIRYNPFDDDDLYSNLLKISDAFMTGDDDDTNIDLTTFSNISIGGYFKASEDIILGESTDDAYLKILKESTIKTEIFLNQNLKNLIDDYTQLTIYSIDISSSEMNLVYKDNLKYIDLLKFKKIRLYNGGVFKILDYEIYPNSNKTLNTIQAIESTGRLVFELIKLIKIKKNNVLSHPVVRNEQLEPKVINGITVSFIENEIEKILIETIKQYCTSLVEEVNMCNSLNIK